MHINIDLIYLITTIISTIAVTVPGVRWWYNKLTSESELLKSFKKMEIVISESDRLSDLGQLSWALEKREQAWLIPLRKISRYELYRERTAFTVLTVVPWPLLAISLTILTVYIIINDRVSAWVITPLFALVLMSVAAIFCRMVLSFGFDKSVKDRALEKLQIAKETDYFE